MRPASALWPSLIQPSLAALAALILATGCMAEGEDSVGDAATAAQARPAAAAASRPDPTAALGAAGLASPTFTAPWAKVPRDVPRHDFAHDWRAGSVADLSVADFDALAGDLKSANPFAPPQAARERRDEPCDVTQRGAGAYPYRLFYVVASTGAAGQASLYPTGGASPTPAVVGTIKDASGNTVTDIQAFAAAFGAFFAVSGNSATVSGHRNQLGRFDPQYVSNNVITDTLIGATKAGSTTIRYFGGVAARLEDQNVTYVQVEWSAVGGDADNWFDVLRSTSPNSGYTVVSPAPVEWNRFGYYCFTDLAAPSCQRVYYQLRTTLAANCTETSQNYYTDTPCP